MTPNEPFKVEHHPEAQRFSVQSGDHLATAAYTRTGDTITFTHTLVPDEIEGQGIATAMATAALAYARAERLKVVPACAFFADFMQKNPEYEDLRAA
jgi:predicted GNAT family acetyltransferase